MAGDVFPFQWLVPLRLVEAEFAQELLHSVLCQFLGFLDLIYALDLFHSALSLADHPPHHSIDYLPHSWLFTSVEFPLPFKAILALLFI